MEIYGIKNNVCDEIDSVIKYGMEAVECKKGQSV
jgi:hypothetical protein